eukprot:gene20058-26777_t
MQEPKTLAEANKRYLGARVRRTFPGFVANGEPRGNAQGGNAGGLCYRDGTVLEASERTVGGQTQLYYDVKYDKSILPNGELRLEERILELLSYQSLLQLIHQPETCRANHAENGNAAPSARDGAGPETPGFKQASRPNGVSRLKRRRCPDDRNKAHKNMDGKGDQSGGAHALRANGASPNHENGAAHKLRANEAAPNHGNGAVHEHHANGAAPNHKHGAAHALRAEGAAHEHGNGAARERHQGGGALATASLVSTPLVKSSSQELDGSASNRLNRVASHGSSQGRAKGSAVLDPEVIDLVDDDEDSYTQNRQHQPSEAARAGHQLQVVRDSSVDCVAGKTDTTKGRAARESEVINLVDDDEGSYTPKRQRQLTQPARAGRQLHFVDDPSGYRLEDSSTPTQQRQPTKVARTGHQLHVVGDHPVDCVDVNGGSSTPTRQHQPSEAAHTGHQLQVVRAPSVDCVAGNAARTKAGRPKKATPQEHHTNSDLGLPHPEPPGVSRSHSSPSKPTTPEALHPHPSSSNPTKPEASQPHPISSNPTLPAVSTAPKSNTDSARASSGHPRSASSQPSPSSRKASGKSWGIPSFDSSPRSPQCGSVPQPKFKPKSGSAAGPPPKARKSKHKPPTPANNPDSPPQPPPKARKSKHKPPTPANNPASPLQPPPKARKSKNKPPNPATTTTATHMPPATAQESTPEPATPGNNTNAPLPAAVLPPVNQAGGAAAAVVQMGPSKQSSDRKNGQLVSMKLINFMNHQNFEIDFGHGEITQAVVQVVLWNGEEDAYRPEDFPDTITVERKLKRTGGNPFRLLNKHGAEVSSKRENVDEVLDYFGINASNPITVTTQDMARTFFQGSNGGGLKEERVRYNYFMEGTMLQESYVKYAESGQDISQWKEANGQARLRYKGFKKDLAEVNRNLDQLRGSEKLKEELQLVEKSLLWIIAREGTQGLESLQVDLTRKLEGLEDLQTNLDKVSELADAKIETSAKLQERMVKTVTWQEGLVRIKDELRLLERKALSDKKGELSEESALKALGQDKSELQAAYQQAIDAFTTREQAVQQGQQALSSLEAEVSAAGAAVQEVRQRCQMAEDERLERVRKMEEIQKALQRCDEGRLNRLALFGGRGAVALHAAVAQNAAKFHRLPVGPVGNHLKLTDSCKNFIPRLGEQHAHQKDNLQQELADERVALQALENAMGDEQRLLRDSELREQALKNRLRADTRALQKAKHSELREQALKNRLRADTRALQKAKREAAAARAVLPELPDGAHNQVAIRLTEERLELARGRVEDAEAELKANEEEVKRSLAESNALQEESEKLSSSQAAVGKKKAKLSKKKEELEQAIILARAHIKDEEVHVRSAVESASAGCSEEEGERAKQELRSLLYTECAKRRSPMRRAEQVTPPAEQVTPSAGQVTPPAGQVTPPADQSGHHQSARSTVKRPLVVDTPPARRQRSMSPKSPDDRHWETPPTRRRRLNRDPDEAGPSGYWARDPDEAGPSGYRGGCPDEAGPSGYRARDPDEAGPSGNRGEYPDEAGPSDYWARDPDEAGPSGNRGEYPDEAGPGDYWARDPDEAGPSNRGEYPDEAGPNGHEAGDSDGAGPSAENESQPAPSQRQEEEDLGRDERDAATESQPGPSQRQEDEPGPSQRREVGGDEEDTAIWEHMDRQLTSDNLELRRIKLNKRLVNAVQRAGGNREELEALQEQKVEKAKIKLELRLEGNIKPSSLWSKKIENKMIKLKLPLEKFREDNKCLDQALQKRLKAYTQLFDDVAKGIGQHFAKVLRRRNHHGTVTVDREKHTLGIEWTECPFRCMDEFDVFMDPINRKVATETALEFAALDLSNQYILLTLETSTAEESLH